MTALLLVLSLLAQEERKISRVASEKYREAARKVEEAAKQIEGKADAAAKALDEVIGDKNIEHKECRLRYAIQGGTYTEPVDFFPHHWRGRARMKQAEGAAGEEKVKLLEGAVEDLQKSVDAKVKASESQLDDARKKLEAAKKGGGPAPVDPLPAFERDLKAYLDDERYVDAREHVAAKGGFLSEDKRAGYVKQVEEKCREFVRHKTDQFRDRLSGVDAPEDLVRMSPGSFDRDFDLPAAAKLVGKPSPEYGWCVKVRGAFETIRARKDALEQLFECAVEAVALVEKGENAWFVAMERLAWTIVDEAANKRATEAKSAVADQRQRLRTEVDGLVKRWAGFDDRVRKAAPSKKEFLERLPKRDPGTYLAQFPTDASGLDKIVSAIDSSVHAEDPSKELAKAEEELRKVWTDRDKLTVESRRRVLSYRVAAAAMRGFLDGKTVEQVSWDVQEHAGDLRAAGGPIEDVKRYGAKVADVFARMR